MNRSMTVRRLAIIGGMGCVATFLAIQASGRAVTTVVGASVPPRETEFIMAALVSVEGASVASDDAPLYVSRRTFNRLRDQAGAAAECDKEGLQLEVLAGPGATAWNIPAGSPLVLTELRHGVPVPMTIAAGDEWFLSGEAVLFAPCPTKP